jgi:hypothetical protein
MFDGFDLQGKWNEISTQPRKNIFPPHGRNTLHGSPHKSNYVSLVTFVNGLKT